jgi:MFS family permease
MIGKAVEFYDFYIFGTAASLVFGPLFFPGASPEAQLLQSWLTFSVAFIARPIGALVFGHFGDRVGRKSTLVASLVIMGLSTFLIAFLPGYDAIGWLAPALLCLLRFGQGFGLGGEWGGAALLAVENAPPGWRGRFGMVPQLGAPVGFIASNGLFLLLGVVLSEADFVSWGWRIPFLASALLVIIGLWVRLKLTETPAFAAALEKAPPPKVPMVEVIRTHPAQVIGGTLAAMICFALFYLATVYALGFGTAQRGFARADFLIMQLVAINALTVGILLAGWGSDRWSARHVLMAGCVLTICASFLTAPWLGTGSAVQVTLYLAAILFAMGFVYGPLGAWLPGLFPARVRYTGASIGFNFGGILGGAFLPTIAASLTASGGLAAVGYYIAGMAVLSFASLWFLGAKPASETSIELL